MKRGLFLHTILFGGSMSVVGSWLTPQARCAPEKQMVEHAVSPNGRYEIVTTYGKGKETIEALQDGKTYPDRIFSLRDRRKKVVLGRFDHILQDGSHAINTDVTAYWSADGTRLLLFYDTHYSYIRLFTIEQDQVKKAKLPQAPGLEEAIAAGGKRQLDPADITQLQAHTDIENVVWRNDHTLSAQFSYGFTGDEETTSGKAVPAYNAFVTGNLIEGRDGWTFQANKVEVNGGSFGLEKKEVKIPQ